jgi:hypothetical protein
MKKVLVILVGTILASAAVQAASGEKGGLINPSVDLVGVGTFYVPTDDDNYDLGAGMEIQGRFWLNPYVGIALAAGSVSWAVNDQDLFISEGTAFLDASIDGDVNMAPLGASLLLRPIRTDRFALTLEAGVRYVFVDSQAEVELQSKGPAGIIYVDDNLDIEDGVVGIAAATLEFKLQDQIFLMGGAGYQYDIQKGDITFLEDTDFPEIDLGENKLEAFIVQAGLGVRF